MQRHKKLENLIKSKKQKFDLPTVLIHNLSEITLPENISKILMKGIHQPVGGRTNKNSILTQFEGLFDSWQKHALKQHLDIFKMTEIRSEIFLEFTKLVKCTTKNDGDILNKFLNNNPNILVCPTDKSKNVCLIDRTLYIKKLDQVFSPDKFLRLKINPINTDLKKIRSLIGTFKPYLSNLEEIKMRPIENLKRGYGLVKVHKNNKLRPIISSLNTVTSGAENFLKLLIAPINSSCKFVVDSTLSFKTKFQEFISSEKFNPQEHEVISYDCQSLYTSINLKRVLKNILDTIYDDIENFFPPKRTRTEKKLGEVFSKQIQTPPRETLENFFMDILTKYSTFEALNGFFRQTNGVSMGGKMSASLANIFCNMFEQDIIESEIQNNTVLAYYRYVDDILVVIKKSNKNMLLDKLNNFDKNLGFTLENMENSRLNFLDTTIVLKDDKLSLEHYRKPSATDCLINYKTGVSPISYKMSAFTGELYRCHHSTTSDVARDQAIEKSKQIYLKNQYPLHILNRKITEVRDRDFQKSDYAKKRQAELENPDLEHYTLSLQYTSQRCSSIATNIYKTINKYTPNFCLKIIFTTLKIDSVIHPRLKPKKNYLQHCNVCYNYICDCEEKYLGETQQMLYTRIKNHRTDENSSIHKHIQTCSTYQQKFYDVLGVDHNSASDKQRLEFFKSHFTIAEKNLLNKNHRKIFEGVLICMQNPTLNTQKDHKIMKLLCPSFLRTPANTGIT